MSRRRSSRMTTAAAGDDAPKLPPGFRKVRRFRWTATPVSAGRLVDVKDDLCFIEIDGDERTQQWWISDVLRWIDEGLFVWE